MAPAFMPKPRTKPVAMLPFFPCRSITAMRNRSRDGSGRLSPSTIAMRLVQVFGDDLAFEDADHVGLLAVGGARKRRRTRAAP
jgi:hypothetical protein